jgi:hypothetical protein
MGFNWSETAQEFKPVKGGKFDTGLETLPDGTYNFIIESVERKEKSASEDIISIGILVADGQHNGHKGRFDTFVKDLDSANRFNGNVLTPLGFQTDQWKKAGASAEDNGKYFTDCLLRALGCMKGLKFEGKKKANPNKNKPGEFYQNINDIKRLADGKPEKIGVAEMTAMLETIDF